MFKNSYDIPGLHFCLITSPDFYGLKKEELDASGKSINHYLDQIVAKGNLSLIDFSMIDGLTIGEVRVTIPKVLPDDFFLIASHTKIGPDDNNISINIGPKFLIEDEKYGEKTPIDQAVEREIFAFYNFNDDFSKRMMLCFLQRYQYGTKEKTDAAIQLIKNNN